MNTPNDRQIVWIVLQYFPETDAVSPFEFQGVFSTKSRALLNCLGANYAIAPVVLDEAMPDFSTNWPGYYYPYLEPDPGDKPVADWYERTYREKRGEETE